VKEAEKRLPAEASTMGSRILVLPILDSHKRNRRAWSRSAIACFQK
jgi:energy-converting hydrogenase Eha subunit A